MAKKKGGKKGKKGKKDKDDEDKITPEEKLRRSDMQIQALERHLVMRTEQSQRARASEAEMKERFVQLNKDFEQEKLDRFNIACDMTRQYKQMQEELIKRINVLSNEKNDLRDKLEMARIALEESKKEKNQVIELKDKELNEAKQKMEEMAIEFGSMLKSTLQKMQVKLQNNVNQDDNNGNAELDISKFKDFGLDKLDINGVKANELLKEN